jgi:hypothetical protein
VVASSEAEAHSNSRRPIFMIAGLIGLVLVGYLFARLRRPAKRQ